jgi:endonuclease I
METLFIKDNLRRARFLTILFLLYLTIDKSYGQLFPGLSGEELTDAIREQFTPGQLLNDTQVKDTLYLKVFKSGDSVRCIYSGLARYLPNGQDPSQWLYGTGLETGSINLEHGWPQAKGAGEGTGGNTNMYHLFPSRTGINSDRGDLPFKDIADQQTSKWYYKEKEMNSIPGLNIQYYSEYINDSFEPRESVKGDIARGMFYFWTIYREDALAEDPSFFNLQVDHLCLWHLQDPVDAAESLRNDVIATYQGGKKNPFIIDCSLVMRAYCDSFPECTVVSTGHRSIKEESIRFQLAAQQLIIDSKDDLVWHLIIADQMGRKVYSGKISANQWSESFNLPSGIYFAMAVSNNNELTRKFVVP